MTIEQELAASIALSQDLTARLERLRTYLRDQGPIDEDVIKIRLSTALHLIHGLDRDGKSPNKKA